MYLFYFILVLFIEILIQIFVGTDIYLALVFCLANIITYPVFLHILTMKTVFTKPIIKDLTYINYNYLGKTEYIVFECKKLLKYNIPWFFLILAPFVINILLDRNMFSNMGIIDIFTVISFLILAFLVVGLYSVMRNFYPKYLLYFFLLSGNILPWSFALDSTGGIKHLLYLSVFFSLFYFVSGILLLLLEKKKKEVS